MDDKNKMRIHLLIDNDRYPLIIAREDEQLYRDAAKQIDYKLNRYRREYPEFSAMKHWAMAALELAFENMSLKDCHDICDFIENKIKTAFPNAQTIIHCEPCKVNELVNV